MNTTSENSRRIERLKKRLENQYPVIGDWIRRQAIRSLERIACPEAVSALSSTVEFSTNPTLKKYVLDALKRIALQPISSTTKTALEAYKVFKVDYGDPDSIAKRETLLEALRGTDSWSTLAAQYALCDVVIKEPNHVLQQFLIQNHFSPPYPHFNLRFLFLTKQFDAADITKHNQADIDFAFGFGYADDITYRVAQVAVEARRLDWAEAALNSVKGLESFHWDAVIEILLESRSESLLWRSLTRIPPIHAATALNRLAERGWRPTSDQRASFEHLLTLANAWPYRSHAITEPAVAVESNWSISSSRDDTVVFFCIDLFVVCEILSSLFMHRQCVLQVRRYSGQKVAKQHTSIGIRGTTFVVSNNGKWLLQGDFDGTVSIRELPSLQLLNSVRAIREAVHTMTVSRNSDVVAICGAASRTNVVLSLPSLQVHAKKASPQVDSSIFDDGAVSITPARSYGTSLMESSRTALRADRLLSVTSDRHLTVLSHFGIHLFRNTDFDRPYFDYVNPARYLPGRDGKHEVRVFSRGIGCEFPSGIAWTPQGSLMALGSSQLFLISIGLQHDTLTAWQRRLGDPVARVRVALRSPDLQSHEQRGLEFIHALWIGSDSASQENSKSLIERLVPKAAQSVERRPDTQSEDGYWSALADIAAIVNDLTSLALDDKEYRWHLDALSGYLQLLPLEVLSTVILNSHSFEGNRQDELARWLSEFGVSISVPAYLIWLAANDGARHRIQDLFPTDRGDSAIQTLDRSFVTRLIWLIAVSKADHATYMFEDNWWKDRATSKFMSLLSSEDVERFWNHISERGLFEAGFDNKANETNDRVFWFVCEWLKRFPDPWKRTLLGASYRHRMLIFRYIISQRSIAENSAMRIYHEFPNRFQGPEWILHAGPLMVRELLLGMFDRFPRDYWRRDDGPAPLLCYCLNQMAAEWEAGFECMTLDELMTLTEKFVMRLNFPPLDLSETILTPPNLYADSRRRLYEDRSWCVFWINPTEVFPLIQNRLGRFGVEPEAPLLATLREALLDWQKKDKADDEDDSY